MKRRPIAFAVELLLSGLLTAGLVWAKLEMAAQRAEAERNPVAIRVSQGSMIALNIARWCDKFWFVLWPMRMGICFLTTFAVASFFTKGKPKRGFQ